MSRNKKKKSKTLQFVALCSELCRKMHEDDPDATAEDCETELSLIWSVRSRFCGSKEFSFFNVLAHKCFHSHIFQLCLR